LLSPMILSPHPKGSASYFLPQAVRILDPPFETPALCKYSLHGDRFKFLVLPFLPASPPLCVQLLPSRIGPFVRRLIQTVPASSPSLTAFPQRWFTPYRAISSYVFVGNSFFPITVKCRIRFPTSLCSFSTLRPLWYGHAPPKCNPKPTVLNLVSSPYFFRDDQYTLFVSDVSRYDL